MGEGGHAQGTLRPPPEKGSGAAGFRGEGGVRGPSGGVRGRSGGGAVRGGRGGGGPRGGEGALRGG